MALIIGTAAKLIPRQDSPAEPPSENPLVDKTVAQFNKRSLIEAINSDSTHASFNPKRRFGGRGVTNVNGYTDALRDRTPYAKDTALLLSRSRIGGETRGSLLESVQKAGLA